MEVRKVRATYLTCEMDVKPGPRQDRYAAPVSLLREYLYGSYLWKGHANGRAWFCSPASGSSLFLRLPLSSPGGEESLSFGRFLDFSPSRGAASLDV